MDVLQHDPSSILDSFLDSFISEIESFSTTDGNGNQFVAGLFTQLFDFEAGVKTWSTGQENWLFGFAWMDSAFEFDGVVVSAFGAENVLDQLISNRIELVGTEGFH